MRTHARAPSSGQAIRGARLAFKRASAVRVCRRRVVTVRAEGENLFQKLGTSLVRAGTTLVGTVSSLGTQKVGRKGATDPKVVFVAGSTGRVGAKVVKECLLAGFSVRAGVRNKEKGEDLIESAKEYLSSRDVRRLQLVEYDLFDEETISPALGNAGLVVCAIGADESKPFDVSGPQKVDGQAAIALVKAAARQGVAQFVMISSLGTTKFGWPASALNLFWGVLYHKKLAEQALQTSGMAYTIIRPGGMERPKDDYKETHNVTLAPRDTYFGGQVSRLQVAELAAACLTSRELSENKVLEIIAEEEAPLLSYEELLEQVPQEISMDEIREKRAMADDAKNKARLLAQELEELEQELVATEEQKILAENNFSEARSQLQTVSKDTRESLAASQASERTLEKLAESLESAKREEAAARAVLDAQRRNARTLELLSPAEIKDITFPILNPDAERPQSKAPAALLGGLFGSKPAPPQEEEETEEEVPAPRAPAFSLFGIKPPSPKVVEEEKEEAPAPKAPAFSLFGIKPPSPKVVEEEEEEEVVPVPVAKRGGFSLFGAKTPEPEVEEEEEVVEEAPVKKTPGGGLFGFFQQETVYADEQTGAPAIMAESVPPPPDVVQRAVTKRGKRAPRQSVKDLVPRKTEEASKPPPAAATPAAPVSEPEQPQVAGFFANLFGGGSKAEEVAAPEPPAPSAPPPAPRDPNVSKSARQEATQAALTNMGVSAVPVRPAPVAVAEKPKAEVKPAPPPAPKPVEEVKVVETPKPVEQPKVEAVEAAKPKVEAAADPAANAAEARAWIAAWRAKNKVKVHA